MSTVARIAPSSLPVPVPVPAAVAATPVALHPDAPRYFLFRGQARAIITATEHYGSVPNLPFDFIRYLDDAAAHRMTITRTFLLYRELQSERNPSSPCKPESPDYLAPYPRSGPGMALDGEPRYDLERWNPEYFARLHAFLRAASERGIMVEMTLFSNTYGDSIWRLNPLRHQNNLQGEGQGEWPEYTSCRDAPRLARQQAFVRKIISECVGYDHVIFEICNEPGGGVPGHVTPAEVDSWQQEVARTALAQLAQLGATHLVVGCEAFTYTPRWTAAQGLDRSFADPVYQSVNVHPLPDVTCAGRVYQLGNFMSKDLCLAELRDFCLAATAFAKPCVLDEDNCASIYRDPTGWAIHRRRAWMALFSGAHYNFIDFSLTVGSEAGSPASRAGLRRPFAILSEFMHGLDLVRTQPRPALLCGVPAHTVAAVLAVADGEYRVYLAECSRAPSAWRGHDAERDCAPAPAGRPLCRILPLPRAGRMLPGDPGER